MQTKSIASGASPALPLLGLVFGALCGAACSSSSTGGGPGPQPATTTVSVSGTVFLASDGSPPSKLSGASIRLAVGGAVVATTQSNANGGYSLQGTVAPGSLVVVTFDSSEAAPVHRTIQAKAQAQTTVNATLRQLKPLECKAGNCALSDGKLTLNGLPGGASGSGRVFNPVTESSAFPGSFADDRGNLLSSGVFASMKLKDGGTKTLASSATPVELTMALPRDTWALIKDIVPDTKDRVEVPLFSFDESKGTWKRDGQGVLVDDSGALINATDGLAAVVAGTWTKGVNARGSVTHFSYWNVDWPIENHTCVTARILTADGKPATGATASVRGVTYTGTSEGSAVGADGRFCADVMRSEGGETQKVSVTVAYAGDAYSFGPFDTSTAQATCGGGGCADLGDLRLTATAKLVVADCTLRGTVVDKQGGGVAQALVIAFDESVPDEALQARCQQSPDYCFPIATTDAAGNFTLKMLVMEGVSGFAFWSSPRTDPSRFRSGSFSTERCPAVPLRVALIEGYDFYGTVTATAFAARKSISWTPPLNAGWVLVSGKPTPENPFGYKWMVAATSDRVGFAGPLTYGTVPSGATQVYPTNGSPPDMTAGDTVDVWLYGISADGFQYFGLGTGTVEP